MKLFKEKDKAELLKQFDEVAPVLRVVKDFDPEFYNELREKLFPSEKSVFVTTGRGIGKTARLGDFVFTEHNHSISFMKSGTGVAVGSSLGEMKRESLIKEVIFNDPATIVIWKDGTKTVVKCQPGDTFSEELGLAMAISKKFLGNKGNFNDEFKKWLPDNLTATARTTISSLDVGEFEFTIELSPESKETLIGKIITDNE